MDDEDFAAVVSAGSLRPGPGIGVAMLHRWTEEGVVVEAPFAGAHLYHLAAAGCVLNDLYREAAELGLVIEGVRVRAAGTFDAATWASEGVIYEVEVMSDGSDADIDRLLLRVDKVAEIPKALRYATSVVRRTTA